MRKRLAVELESMKNMQDAIRILQDAASKVTYDGKGAREASAAITSLHNAVFYLLTGRMIQFQA
jgi:hypothetical protein